MNLTIKGVSFAGLGCYTRSQRSSTCSRGERWEYVATSRENSGGKRGEGNWLGPSWSQQARLAQPHHLTAVSYTYAIQLPLSPTHATCQATSLEFVDKQLLDLSGLASDQVSHGYVVTALDRNLLPTSSQKRALCSFFH